MVVSLKKGQGVSLEKDERPLDAVYLGLGWDAAGGREKGLLGWLLGSPGRAIDLDASCVRLGQLPPHVTTLVFTITSYSGQSLGAVANAFCRLVDERTGQQVARFDLGCQGAHTGLTMTRFDPTARGWRMTAVGEPGFGRTWHDLVPGARDLARA